MAAYALVICNSSGSILLILGGIFSFLPVLGLWMLPLGLLLIAQDVPLLQKASDGCVCVGRGEVGVAKSEMEKQVMPCQG